MTVLLIILGMVSVILLFLFLMQKYEMKSVSRQLEKIRMEDTNELLHTQYGGKIARELIGEINGTLKELRQSKIDYNKKSHALEQMMTNISHDLRTPLTSALGYVNLMQDPDISGEEKQREIAIVEKRLIRLEELIDSFFELSKIISQNKQPETEQIELVSVLEECIVHYYDDFCGSGRKIEFLCSSRKIEVVSNKNMLVRIFDNLIGNAYKHGTGDLVVSVEAAGKIEVCFTNELYDSEIDTDRIFEEFYTTDISRTKGNTGLGLAIAKQFTELLGGRIRAEYDKNRFVVTVRLEKTAQTVFKHKTFEERLAEYNGEISTRNFWR